MLQHSQLLYSSYLLDSWLAVSKSHSFTLYIIFYQYNLKVFESSLKTITPTTVIF